MVVPVTVVEIVTFCVALYSPAATENKGVSTVPLMVKVAELTVELLNWDFTANALRVLVEVTLIVLLYNVDEVVGVDPSVV